MVKVRLVFKGISEIIGSNELGLLILTDVAETLQIAIVCDKQMEYQFGLRMGKASVTDRLLPESMWRMFRMQQGEVRWEVLINDISDGQYRAMIINNDTFDMTSVRVSDGILLSYMAGIPLYMEEKLLLRQSVPFREQANGMSIPINAINREMLQEALDKAVEEENYELASHLRDEMNRRKKG